MYSNILRLISSPQNKYNIIRRLGTTNILPASAYEGEGKTHAIILNKEEDANLMIDAVSEVGFRLNNNVTVLGSMVIFQRSLLSWNIKYPNEMKEAHFSLFEVLVPKPELLVVGVGDEQYNRELCNRVFLIGKKLKITTEVLSTEHAIASFNFMISEGRHIAACLVPPQVIKHTHGDFVSTNIRYNEALKLKWE